MSKPLFDPPAATAPLNRGWFRRTLRMASAVVLTLRVAGRLLAAEEPNAVFVMNVDGSGVRELARIDPTASHDYPRWSHDGKRVAFDVLLVGTKIRKIYRIAADGTDLKELGPDAMPDWSPDDKQLVSHRFIGGSAPPEVFVKDVDGQGQELVARGRSPRWSPDGGKLALSDLTMLRTVDLLSGEETQLFDKPVEQIFSGFGWSPDGKKLAVVVRPQPNAQRQLLIVDAQGAKFGRQVRLTQTVGGAVGWSPDGSQLVVSLAGKLHVVDVAGKGKPRLIPGQTGKNQSPAWSPDGKRIVYVGVGK